MECAHCKHKNADGARFCGECGASLTRDVTCSGCGHSNPPGQKFCNGCGQSLGTSAPSPTRDPRAYTPKHLAEKILTSRTVLEGERKQVTILFADVKGSMDLAERLDPEAWHGIMDRFFQLLAEGVHRFEGTVNQYTGDGIMALFGAPIAHEDHAQRACYAALHLQHELRRYADELRLEHGLGFSVRMGLNSGEVVVGKIGDDFRMEYTAQGHTVGLAARMEQMADPGKTLLTGHTAKLVSGYFQLRDLGETRVKGLNHLLHVFELESVGRMRTRLDVSHARGFSRFVGRTDEMAVLEAALARALEGEGQVVGVVADAGVGKSRLCFEFLERCRARGIATYRASGVAHGKSVPLLPVLELQRDYFGITAADSAAIAREKIAGRLLLLDRAFDEVLPVVFDFLGVGDRERPAPPMEPEVRQRLLFEVLRRAIQLRGRREPTVTLLEDLHWFDDGSDAFLGPLVEARSGTCALLVLNFRPDYRADWMQTSYYQQLPLRTLGAPATEELLRELLGTDPSLVELPAQIRERTGGNPFFMEEVVRALEETGGLVGARGAYRLGRPVEAVAVPATVQAVLAARIDRLSEQEKSVLQTAAVIGKEFTAPVLRLVTGLPAATLAAALDTVARAEFLHETALYPEAEYAFKHPLTQEVAYRSLLGERRRQIHDAVARAIETTSREKLDERAALVAHHWECAGDALKATRWHHQAGRWLRAQNVLEAMRHWRRARELLREVPESEDAMRLGLAVRRNLLGHSWIVGMPDDEARVLLEEGSALATRRKDIRSLALLRWGYGESRRSRGWVVEHSEHLREVLRLSEEVGDDALTYAARASLVMTNATCGKLHEAQRDAAELLDRPPPDYRYGAQFLAGGATPLAATNVYLGRALIEQGRLNEGETHLQRTLRLGAEFGDKPALVMGRSHLALLSYYRGDVRGATDAARLVMEIAGRYASRGSQPSAQAREAVALAHLGRQEWEEAATAFEAGLAFCRKHGVRLDMEAEELAWLAEAHLGRGDPRTALATAEEAREIGRSRGQQLGELDAEIVRARALVRLGGPDAAAAEAALAAAEALVERTGAGSRAPFLHLARAELAAARGDPATQECELREAQRLFTEMGAPLRAEQVARELGSSAASAAGIPSTSRT